MIVRDKRCGREFIGDPVEEIPGNRAMTDEQVEKYLGMSPDIDEEKFRQYKRPTKHRRLVLKRHVGEGFWVVPLSGHYEVIA